MDKMVFEKKDLAFDPEKDKPREQAAPSPQGSTVLYIHVTCCVFLLS